MFISNVSDYAPEGYKLAGSHAADGKVTHVFSAPGKPDLVCEGSWQSAEDERVELERFQAAHKPQPREVTVPVRLRKKADG